MPVLPVVFHPEAVEKPLRLDCGMQKEASPLQTPFSPNLIMESNPSLKRPIAGHYLYTTLAVIYSIGFRSRSFIESPTIIEVVAIAHGRRRPGYWRSQ